MPSGIARKGGKKNRKFKRNKDKCAIYAREGRREKNKAKKLAKHLRRHGTDVQAKHCLNNL